VSAQDWEASPDPHKSWLTIALECRARGDEEGEQRALRAQLAVDRRDIRALLGMGELLARRGDDRAAVSFFRLALKVASGPGGYPSDMLPQLVRAQAFAKEAESRFTRQLQAELERRAMTKGKLSPRVAHAVKLLLGEVPLHLQQPNMFYFPELPQRAFFERDEFGWAGAVEAYTDQIEKEVEALIALDDFAPHTVPDPRTPPSASPLLNDARWSVFHLWQRGTPVRNHISRVPRTVEALSHAPIPRIHGFAPMIMFSLLRPGTNIPQHHGVTNTRLICHLPILAPPACALRVGSEVRTWQRGQMLVFDDSFEHEAWNHGSEVRVVLLFEIWRPDISMAERDELTTLFEAVELGAIEAAEAA
jgi:aspartyl/asparaginyl beta-hydroxylase (cupin superfamily)